MEYKTEKAYRLLYMSDKLRMGANLKKLNILKELNIPSKTFQRDLDSLRLYFDENGVGDIVYDRKTDCYRLNAKTDKLTKKEIFAICKIMTESRAFNRAEFYEIIEKLLKLCEAGEGKTVRALIANEQLNYIQLRHGRPLVDVLWELSECVTEQRVIEIAYVRKDGTARKHEVKPVGIMFSEFYFYLIAFMSDDSKHYPTVFRVDRIDSMEQSNERFHIPYAERFSEAEFRKRVQFMYSGELRTVRFLYRGSLEAVCDRLPTARVTEMVEDGMLISAEVYGTGIDMWLKSQGKKVEMIPVKL